MKSHSFLDIRYIKLHFLITMTEDTILPVNKVSALRGGMGEMLLRENCVRDRNCDSCDFYDECLVQRTMYSPMEKYPSFMTSNGSVGYIIECEDYRSEVRSGDMIPFNLILFGKSIVYFSQFLRAFFALGQQGLGKNQSHFIITSVSNTLGEAILEDQCILMERYRVTTVSEYVSFRRKQIEERSQAGDFLKIKLQSPMLLKAGQETLEEIRMDAFLAAIARRIYMLDCYEGIDVPMVNVEDVTIPEIHAQEYKKRSVARFSNRRQEKMVFHGIEGNVTIEMPAPDVLELLLAGELIHVGKNTSFGFGRYRVAREKS